MEIVTTQPSSYLLFKDLDADEETQKIRARVIVSWRSYRSGSKSTLVEMVLVDDEGVRIHASIDEQLLKKQKLIIKEGDAITVNAFEMKDNYGTYRTSPLPHKIFLMRTSIIQIIHDFPKHTPEIYFKDFKEIRDGHCDKDILIDVIGQLLTVGPLEDVQTKGKSGIIKKMDLILLDTDGERLTATMWGEYAKLCSEYKEPDDRTPTICVLRFVSIKEYQGNISVQNAFNATRLYFNPDVDYVKDFVKRIPSENAMISHSNNSQISYVGSSSKRNDFFSNSKRKTILGIQETIELGSFVTSAYVTEVDMNKKWFNVACPTCRKKVQAWGHPEPLPDDYKTLYNCEVHGDMVDVIYKYYLILRVSDESAGEIKILLFDKIADSFVGESANVLYEEVAGRGKRALPNALKRLYGKKCLLKLKVEQNKEKPMIVESFWLNEDDIDLFEKTVRIEENDMPLMITDSFGDYTLQDSSSTPISKRTSDSTESIGNIDQNSVSKKIKLESIK